MTCDELFSRLAGDPTPLKAFAMKYVDVAGDDIEHEPYALREEIIHSLRDNAKNWQGRAKNKGLPVEKWLIAMGAPEVLCDLYAEASLTGQDPSEYFVAAIIKEIDPYIW